MKAIRGHSETRKMGDGGETCECIVVDKESGMIIVYPGEKPGLKVSVRGRDVLHMRAHHQVAQITTFTKIEPQTTNISLQLSF